jgi:putative two-component system response regulator
MQASILAIDDQPDNLRVIAELLRPRYRMQIATGPVRGLDLARAEPRPDLVLLDIGMPEMDGFQVLQALKADIRTRDTPVIFLTAHDSSSEEQRGLALGAVDYVNKPLVPEVLLARVHTQIAFKRARDQLREHNRSLEAEVAERMRDNEAIQDVSILALARLAETRDPETGNHLLRTQGYLRLLAQRVAQHPRFAAALDEQSIELMAKSAPLHDIGKVSIPDAILLKPGKLDAAEWEIMKRHAEAGSRAIEAAEAQAGRVVPFLRYAKQIAHWHHERWDGSGYPDGLSGDAIPLAARLMALADVFDALLSRRSYKEPMSSEHARSLIAEQRGRHFDPDLTDAFLAHFDEFAAIAQRHSDPESVLEPV